MHLSLFLNFCTNWFRIAENDPCANLRREFENYRRQSEKQFATISGAFADVERKFGYLSESLVAERISNVVGELLLFVIGFQPNPHGESNYFSGRLRSDRRTRADKLMNILVRERIIRKENFNLTADSLINKRNRSVHFSTKADLQHDVNDAVRAFEAFPNLKATMPLELCILQKFDAFDSASLFEEL